MSEECPIGFEGVTIEDLAKAKEEGKPVTIILERPECLRSFPIIYPVTVTKIDLLESGRTSFWGKTITSDNKEWTCYGLIEDGKGMLALS